MNRFPEGPSPEQVIRDCAGEPSKAMDAVRAIVILQRRQANCRNLQRSLRWPYRDGRKPTPQQEAEVRAAEWQHQCEIDALDVAITMLKVQPGEPSVTLGENTF